MTNIKLSIEHQQSSHCETGVISTLLRSKGLDISEPMAFGLSSALAFVYLPIVKLGGLPLIAYRMPPKTIIKTVCKKLKVDLHSQTFSNQDKGMKALDDELAKGNLVGLQTSVYWLPYFPEDMRFHFNAHNLVVYGKTDEGNYLISDPVFEHLVECPSKDLQRARFAKGALAAKGRMYVVRQVPEQVDLTPHIYSAIKKTARMMNGMPVPFIGNFFGAKGIKTLAKKISSLSKSKPKYQKLFLGNIVRMQEEIGTGGAGFRFMFASFLNESAEITGNIKLQSIAKQTTAIGDNWREFAMEAVLFCKKRKELTLDNVADKLTSCAVQEQSLRADLLKIQR
jgi:hypothetical protein